MGEGAHECVVMVLFLKSYRPYVQTNAFVWTHSHISLLNIQRRSQTTPRETLTAASLTLEPTSIDAQ